MGCKCCRMIQRFIFDAPEPLNPTDPSISSNNDPEIDQEKAKVDTEMMIHKYELHNAEPNVTANNNKPCNFKAGYKNHGSNVHEEGVGSCVQKCDASINGLVSNALLYPVLNYHRKETGNDAHLTPFSESVVAGYFETMTLSQFNTAGRESVSEVDTNAKLASEDSRSVHDGSSQSVEENNSLTESAILEMPNATPHMQNGIPNDYCQAGYSSDAEVIALSNNAEDSEQEIEFPVWKCHSFYLCLDRNGVLDPSEERNPNGLSGVYFKESLYAGGQWIEPVVVVDEGVAEDFSSEELNGESIEDADVAEALAALEAATAGEDEDEDEEY